VDGGANWTSILAATSGETVLSGVWGDGATVVAVGYRVPGTGATTAFIMRSSNGGANWTEASLAGTDSRRLNGVWVSGGTLVAVGRETVSRDADDNPTYGGLVLRSTDGGASWTSAIAPGAELQLASVWGASANALYAVGTRGTLLHYNGTSWNPATQGWVQISSGVSGTLFDVGGSSARDVFAVGAGGVVIRGHR
jgi:hypothetical protein